MILKKGIIRDEISWMCSNIDEDVSFADQKYLWFDGILSQIHGTISMPLFEELSEMYASK